MLALARRLSRATGERNLVFAGGVALNCVSNARLEREGPFRSLFIIGAAHDAGTAIGAAFDVALSAGFFRSRDSRQPALLANTFSGQLVWKRPRQGGTCAGGLSV